MLGNAAGGGAAALLVLLLLLTFAAAAAAASPVAEATSPRANTRAYPETRSVASVMIFFERWSRGNGHASGDSTRCPTAQHTASYSSVVSPSAAGEVNVRLAAEGNVDDDDASAVPPAGGPTRVARTPSLTVTPAAASDLAAASRCPAGEEAMMPDCDAMSSSG